MHWSVSPASKLRTVLGGTIAAGVLFVAAAPAHAERWLGSTIKWIYPQANGSVVLAFTVDSPDCTNGSTPKYYLLAVGAGGVTAEGLKNMLAVAIAAFGSGKPIAVAFDETTSSCTINRLYIYE